MISYTIEQEEIVKPEQEVDVSLKDIAEKNVDKGELFRGMLLQDREFEPLRKSLRDAEYPLLLQPSKTIVLVRRTFVIR